MNNYITFTYHKNWRSVRACNATNIKINIMATDGHTP
jgi:hypothetical protein